MNAVVQRAFRDELQKIAFVSSGFRRLAELTFSKAKKPGFSRSVAQKAAKTAIDGIGSTSGGAGGLLRARVPAGGTQLTPRDHDINGALLKAALPGVRTRKPLNPQTQLTNFKLDGEFVPASAFADMSKTKATELAWSLGHKGPLNIPGGVTRRVNLPQAQQTLDAAALGQGRIGEALVDLQRADPARIADVGIEEAMAASVKALPGVTRKIKTVLGRPPTSTPGRPPY